VLSSTCAPQNQMKSASPAAPANVGNAIPVAALLSPAYARTPVFPVEFSMRTHARYHPFGYDSACAGLPVFTGLLALSSSVRAPVAVSYLTVYERSGVPVVSICNTAWVAAPPPALKNTE
jgi:hypothetical protein